MKSSTSSTLTQKGIERVRPPAKGSKVHWDDLVKGLGLRANAGGKKSWYVTARMPGGKQIADTLGDTGLIPSVADARNKAREFILTVKSGRDPRAVKRAQEAAEKIEAEANANTVAMLTTKFLQHPAHTLNKATGEPLKASSLAETERLLRRVIGEAPFANKPARDVTQREIEAYADSAKARKETASRIRRLGLVFAWAIEQGDLETNPIAGL